MSQPLLAHFPLVVRLLSLADLTAHKSLRLVLGLTVQLVLGLTVQLVPRLSLRLVFRLSLRLVPLGVRYLLGEPRRSH
jgi:hypothetical protein